MANTVMLRAFIFIITLCVLAQIPSTNSEETQPGDAAFELHRPIYHFIARQGWQNDACGPFYEPNTDTYHMFYQLNPFASYWGNMTWGHATSKDQLVWEDKPNALLPDGKWDNEGVFSGSALTNAVGNLPTIFYTGVAKIASTQNQHDTEHVVYAVSKDNGAKWEKGLDTLIAYPPKGMNVYGWRDPYVFKSVYLDRVFGYSSATNSSTPSDHNYLIVSGSLRNPDVCKIFLYHSTDYRNWEEKGFLFSADTYSKFEPDSVEPLSSNFGSNFEMTQYLELPDPVTGKLHSAMILGVEKNRGPDSTKTGHVLWLIGSIASDNSNTNTTGLMIPSAVGIIDAGLWYGSMLYKDKHGKYVAIGWATEDVKKNVFEGSMPNPQGWSGLLSLPREVGLSVIEDIYDPQNLLDSKGPWITSHQQKKGNYETKRILTLLQKPIESVRNLRGSMGSTFSVDLSSPPFSAQLPTQSKSFELYTEVEKIPNGSCFGIQIRSSFDNKQFTRIYYNDKLRQIVLDKSHSTDGTCLKLLKADLTDDVAHFWLFDQVKHVQQTTTNDQWQLRKETLRLRLFVDVSVVEVYANDRLAMTSRIYPCGIDEAQGISVFASEAGAEVRRLEIWPTMQPAWPKRGFKVAPRVPKPPAVDQPKEEPKSEQPREPENPKSASCAKRTSGIVGLLVALCIVAVFREAEL